MKKLNFQSHGNKSIDGYDNDVISGCNTGLDRENNEIVLRKS